MVADILGFRRVLEFLLITTSSESCTQTAAHRRLALGLGCVLTLGLVGCSAGGPAPIPDDLPLERELAEIRALTQGDADATDGTESRVQDVIAGCMKQQGFDYTPAVPPDAVGGTSGPGDAGDAMVRAQETLSPEEFARQYGYGITTSSATQDDANDDAGNDAWVDPNAARVEAMSEEERDAYWHALNGWPEGDQGPGENLEGCDARARQQVETQNTALEAVYADPTYAELTAAMVGVLTLDPDDSRLATVTGEWSQCMADSGFPDLASTEEAQGSITELAYEDTDGLWSPRDLSPDELGAIRELEIATATADHLCQEEVGYREEYRRALADDQQQFLDAYREDIDAFKDAVMLALADDAP